MSRPAPSALDSPAPQRSKARPAGPVAWLGPAAVGLVGLVGLVGCASARHPSATRPTAADDIEAELARSEQALREVGVTVQAPPTADFAATTAARPVEAGPTDPSPPPAAKTTVGQGAGVPAASAPEQTTDFEAETDGLSRCERICQLDTAICELSAHVCGLAERHPDDTRHVQACARAEGLCDAATVACSDCAPGEDP